MPFQKLTNSVFFRTVQNPTGKVVSTILTADSQHYTLPSTSFYACHTTKANTFSIQFTLDMKMFPGLSLSVYINNSSVEDMSLCKFGLPYQQTVKH
jgi:hypothetical protein